MMQWRMILAVVIVALGAAAIWAWQEGSQHEDATLARAVLLRLSSSRSFQQRIRLL